MKQTYNNWKTVTEADFVSMFIKTWFAYISTLREMFPEAYNRRGDKKYLNAYKDYYKKEGYKNIIVDENVMGSIEKLYRQGRKIIMTQYPEYYFWDFYRLNDDFNFIFKEISPDKTDGFIAGLKLVRNRGSSHSFKITGFIRLWGTVRSIKYNDNVNINVDISDILKSIEVLIKENPSLTEQDYFSFVIDTILDCVLQGLSSSFELLKLQKTLSKSVMTKYEEALLKSNAIVRSVFSLNAKDETYKTLDEMDLNRNTYEIIQQRPINYFEYHMDVPLSPDRELVAREDRWYKALHEQLKRHCIIWFLDFVYRLRNALFHEIIDPLDEEWQGIFKNAYLVLKEIVDVNIDELNKPKPEIIIK